MKRHIFLLWFIGYTVYSATTLLYAQNTSATTKVSPSQPIPLSDFEQKRLSAIEHLGKKENHDTIYRFISQGMVEKNSSMIQSNRLLTKETQFPIPIGEEATQKVPWLLAYDGYSIEKIQELYDQYSINLIEINTRTFNPIVNAVCIAPLIVSVRVDTIYTDRNIEDGFRTSIILTIKETIKGDTTIKRAIIRDNTGEMVIRGGQRVF